MIVVVLSWQEPQEGSHAILFPDEDRADLVQAAEWVEKKAGDEYGSNIARVELVQKGRAADDGESGAWEDLGLNTRYSSGEELYDEDCPAFTKHGVERS
jgi:hypothetical protein